MSSIGISTEKESRLVVIRGLGETEIEVMTMGIGFLSFFLSFLFLLEGLSFCSDEFFLKLAVMGFPRWQKSRRT